MLPAARVMLELRSPARQHRRARAAAHVWPACGTRQRARGRPSLGGGARGEDLVTALYSTPRHVYKIKKAAYLANVRGTEKPIEPPEPRP